jgi:signal transduction histidine kinase
MQEKSLRKYCISAGRRIQRKHRTDLNKLIGEWIDFFESRCAKSGIQIVVERDEGLPIVKGDPAQLNQVIVNVVSMPSRPCLTAAR